MNDILKLIENLGINAIPVIKNYIEENEDEDFFNELGDSIGLDTIAEFVSKTTNISTGHLLASLQGREDILLFSWEMSDDPLVIPPKDIESPKSDSQVAAEILLRDLLQQADLSGLPEALDSFIQKDSDFAIQMAEMLFTGDYEDIFHINLQAGLYLSPDMLIYAILNRPDMLMLSAVWDDNDSDDTVSTHFYYIAQNITNRDFFQIDSEKIYQIAGMTGLNVDRIPWDQVAAIVKEECDNLSVVMALLGKDFSSKDFSNKNKTQFNIDIRTCLMKSQFVIEDQLVELFLQQ